MNRNCEVEKIADLGCWLTGERFVALCGLKTWRNRSRKKRRLVFFFRHTSQRKEQMIHSKICPSHDAIQSTSFLDKANRIYVTLSS